MINTHIYIYDIILTCDKFKTCCYNKYITIIIYFDDNNKNNK